MFRPESLSMLIDAKMWDGYMLVEIRFEIYYCARCWTVYEQEPLDYNGLCEACDAQIEDSSRRKPEIVDWQKVGF